MIESQPIWPQVSELCLPYQVEKNIYLTFDKTVELCQAEYMFHSTKKFVAVLIAIWLPLFSGNALAVSVAMQAMSVDGHAVVAQEGEHCPHHASAAQHIQYAADQDQSAGLQDQQDSPCGSSGICHLACSGYIAAASIELAQAPAFALTYEPSVTRFQSIALTPLDPPPLARA